jgi:hypothetical protein
MKRLVVAVAAALTLCASGAALSGFPPSQTGSKPAAAASKLAAADLDRLLAPVALYPDALLGQMLLCAANPATIGALDEWLRSQGALKGTELQDAAKASGFGDSYVAIVLFPDVVGMMAQQVEWTTSIGKAFEADKSGVFASVQRLRTKARDAGKLKSSPQQDVETRTTSSGEQVIIIEPANPQVVYVPQYNPQTVYVPTTTSTTVVVQEDDDSGAAIAAGLIGFTAGIAIGAAIDNDYYYGPYGWGGGFHMYNDAWDDWYDHREDAREDWMDHREDMAEERGERARETQEQRTDRQQTRQDTRSGTQAERTERQQTRQETRPDAQAARDQRSSGTSPSATSASSTARTSAEARGYSRDAAKATSDRSGTRSDAFSGYSSGKSTRAASSRGQRSRSSSGGGRRR